MTDDASRHRPLIGYTVGTRHDHFICVLLRLAIQLAGGRGVRLTRSPEASAEEPDGLLLGGGLDIHPARYRGDEDHVSKYDLDRDVLEWEWLEWAHNAPVPVLGICRGLQMMNVHAGGDLLQVLDPDVADSLPNGPIGYAFFRKPIRIDGQSHLARATGATSLEVNSLHSQAVRNPAPGYRVVARERASEGIQAIESDQPHLRMGVQYHPELLLHQEAARGLFRYFVEHCRPCFSPVPAV
ncbi:gamma-glutamyl-gamma-aminobutyrate hydrolase family protein [Maricaulis sp. CAU 1757]